MPCHRPPDRRRLRLQHRHASRGLTTIELLLALAILGLLSALAIPSWASAVDRQRLLALTAQATALLQLARLEAQLRDEPLRLSLVDLPGRRDACLIVHTGSAGDCACLPPVGGHPASTLPPPIPVAGPVCAHPAEVLSQVVIPPEHGLALRLQGRSLLYDPNLGTTSPTGTLRIANRAGEIALVVGITGRVRRCEAASC